MRERERGEETDGVAGAIHCALGVGLNWLGDYMGRRARCMSSEYHIYVVQSATSRRSHEPVERRRRRRKEREKEREN